jgi:ATP-dependent Lon protease
MAEARSAADRKATFPVLPLRDIVVYPKMAAPLFVGREKSVRALDEVMRKDKQILLAAQMDASEDEPTADRIFTVGTVATVVQLLKLPDGTVRVLVEGAHRAKITNFHENDSYFEAETEELPTRTPTPLKRARCARGRRPVGQLHQAVAQDAARR